MLDGQAFTPLSCGDAGPQDTGRLYFAVQILPISPLRREPSLQF